VVDGSALEGVGVAVGGSLAGGSWVQAARDRSSRADSRIEIQRFMGFSPFLFCIRENQRLAGWSSSHAATNVAYYIYNPARGCARCLVKTFEPQRFDVGKWSDDKLAKQDVEDAIPYGIC
jgi:hypothetical protein